MKKLFVLILAIAATFSVKAQNPSSPTPANTSTSTQTTTSQPDPNAPVFKFDAESFDFGTIPQGTPAPHTFTFTNVGKSPLIISDCQGSCHCTKPTWSSEPVLPGKTGTVTATYNADMPGAFTKTVTIHSNATEGSKVVTIKGTVQPKPTDQTTPDNQQNIINNTNTTQPK